MKTYLKSEAKWVLEPTFGYPSAKRGLASFKTQFYTFSGSLTLVTPPSSLTLSRPNPTPLPYGLFPGNLISQIIQAQKTVRSKTLKFWKFITTNCSMSIGRMRELKGLKLDRWVSENGFAMI